MIDQEVSELRVIRIGRAGTAEPWVDALPAETRRLVLVAVADPTGDPGLLWRAAGQLGIPVQAATAVAVVVDILDGPLHVGFSAGDSPAPTAFAELQFAPWQRLELRWLAILADRDSPSGQRLLRRSGGWHRLQ